MHYTSKSRSKMYRANFTKCCTNITKLLRRTNKEREDEKDYE